MRTIDIAEILSPDLKSRMRVQDLKMYIGNGGADAVTITNVPEDIKTMLDGVSRTQVKAKVIPSHTPEIVFKDVNEFLQYVSNPVH